MALPADRTNIGLILIKKDAPAENLRVPPFILQALLRSAGSVTVADVKTANEALITYIGSPDGAANSFQHILRANQSTSNLQQPAVYYNITTGDITPIVYNDKPISDLKTIKFTKAEINEFLTIYKTLQTTRVDNEAFQGYFANRIKLVTTVFTKIYENLTTELTTADKKKVDDGAIKAIQDAYNNTTIGGVAGGAFTHFFKTIIIEGGLTSNVYNAKTKLDKIDVTNTTEVELFEHYLNATTDGSSTLFNKVVITDNKNKQNILLFFTDYLKAKKEEAFKGGFRRRRNRKSSKRRSQKKNSKRRRSKRIRRSHKK